MAGVKGRSGTNKGKDKPFADALRMEEALAANGEETPAKPGSLRFIARQMLMRAGADTQTADKVADRLDGKPAQAIIGDGDEDPINIVTRIEIVAPDGGG